MKRSVQVGMYALAIVLALTWTAREAAPGSGSVRISEAAIQTQGSCPFHGRMFQLFEDLPVVNATVIVTGGGASTSSDSLGMFSLGLSPGLVQTLRFVTPTDAIVIWAKVALTNLNQFDDFEVLRQGTTDVRIGVTSNCQLLDLGVVEQARYEGPVSRPAMPQLPESFRPSAATLAATAPEGGAGNGGNVPWIGYMWSSAPVVTVGLCESQHTLMAGAAEQAIEVWKTAPGLGWKITRNDDACSPTFKEPKILVQREGPGFPRFAAGRALGLDAKGERCKVDLAGTACWMNQVTVELSVRAFDRLPPNQRVATVLHELGHALGLAHARSCSQQTVMWHDFFCPQLAATQVGADDIASANELLAETLRVLKAAAPVAPVAPAAPPQDGSGSSPPAGPPVDPPPAPGAEEGAAPMPVE